MSILQKVRRNILVQTFQEFTEDDAPRSAAALAYYTIFAIPPILSITLMVAGNFMEPQEVTTWIQTQLGPQTGDAIGDIIESANQRALAGGFSIALILGVAGLIFSATGAFIQLQKALNDAWEVAPDNEQKGLGKFLQVALKRLVSLGMILVIAFLVLVAMVATGAISTFAGAIVDYLANYGLTEGLSRFFLWFADAFVSTFIFTLLFGAIFMVLPDAMVRWRHVYIGALVTAVLFVIGKIAIGWYIGSSSPGDAFGAAGALAAMLVFVYYASMILLFGAEFTQIWAQRRGEGIRPAKHAVRVVRERRRIREERREAARGSHVP